MMKITIKVKEIVKGCKFEILDKGDWIDLKAASSYEFIAPQAETLKKAKKGDNIYNYRNVNFKSKLVPLGIAMKLPKGYEAIIAPRSSSFKNFGIIQSNSIGVIDNAYSGNKDEWKYPIIAINSGKITEGDRICQFRIQLSQKATMWQKLKWLFTSGYKFKWVNNFKDKDRGGFGSTGIN